MKSNQNKLFNNKNQIGPHHIKEFLKENGYDPTEIEMKWIFRRINLTISVSNGLF